MIIMMNSPTSEQKQRIIEKLRQNGLEAHCLDSNGKTIVTAIGDSRFYDSDLYSRMPGVEKVVPVLTPFKLASREFCRATTKVAVGAAVFGGENIPVIAGPCAVESYEQLLETACSVKKAGASLLRGGVYKPRTSPYSFQGLEDEGLRILHEVGRKTQLPIVTEVTDPRKVDTLADYVDVIQIGARNMQNYVLLKEVAQTKKPVVLKRGLANTVEEWLMAAEYILAGGNDQILLCERGIRTFEHYTRNTLDLNAVPLIKSLSHLPIIVDPSHGTGDWKLVSPMAKAAVAAGADGLIIEVHPCPEEALSDGPQSLTIQKFSSLMGELKRVALAVERKIK